MNVLLYSFYLFYYTNKNITQLPVVRVADFSSCQIVTARDNTGFKGIVGNSSFQGSHRPKRFHGFLTRLRHEINWADLGKVPSGTVSWCLLRQVVFVTPTDPPQNFLRAQHQTFYRANKSSKLWSSWWWAVRWLVTGSEHWGRNTWDT